MSFAIGGFDTHGNNYRTQAQLQQETFDLVAALVRSLDATPHPTKNGAKLSEHTHILVVSEFCRTPQINLGMGRDHYPNNSALVISPRFKTNLVFGKSDPEAAPPDDGEEVRRRRARHRAAGSARDVPRGVRRRAAEVHARRRGGGGAPQDMRGLDVGARDRSSPSGALLGLAFVAMSHLGCGPAPHTRGAGAVSPLAVRSVAWNPSNAPVGSVRAVADAGDVVAVFSDRGATVFSVRSAVAIDAKVSDWTSAGSIAGADGTAQWIVGVSGAGRIYHLRGLSAFEDVTDRYGLGCAHVLGVTPLGSGSVGFLLGREIAIADGAHVTRYASPAGPAQGVTFDELVGGAGFGAGVAPDACASSMPRAER